MNDPEASLAVKAWWASRDALGGGGREPDVRHLPHPFLSWGALGLHYAVATWDPRSAPCLGAFFIR